MHVHEIKNIVLYCIVLYCIVLYCIVLYCIVLYCIFLTETDKMPASDPNQWDDWADRMTRQEVKQEKRRIMKNILLISIGFLFNFTAFQVCHH